jgi:hypothetical protein
MAGDGTVTTDDLFILVPWLLFAASVGIIVLVVRRRRPPYPDAKPARTTDKSPEARTYSAKAKKPGETVQYGDGQQPAGHDGQQPAGHHGQRPAGHYRQRAAHGEDRGEPVARGENRSDLTAGGEDRESENHQSQG